MADDTTASIITLHQPPSKPAKTPAQRAKSYRQRKKTKVVPAMPVAAQASTTLPEPDKAPVTAVQPQTVTPGIVTPSRSRVTPILLTASALALAGVGMTMNGWFARSLGSSDIAGWLFLAIGVASDLVALVVPSCAARLWQGRQRAIALAGWAVWAMTFVFAVTAGIGFASTNIADVTLARASRTTPAVQTGQAAVCTENLSSGVVAVKSAKDGV